MSERKNKIEVIFHSASELSVGEKRERYLNEACLGDEDLRQEVNALLEAARAGEELFRGFEQNVRLSGGTAMEGLAERPGSVIGRYKLLEKIGEGGMGVVYMAEQEQPVRRKVALKIIKLGMDTRQVVARFEAERQALAMMDHPNIAQVLDAGATDTGRPYFVMELVQGVPITQFCEENRLAIKERLKLFLLVCHAIQSAHQKGIIHRDIKPSNVLVTLHNGTAHPMVIDFGVAKAIDQKLTEKTLFTNFATMIGTPAYMSPEQAEMSKLDVDTRSDIYSLGVLLYELITGTTPFSEERLRSVAYGEMQRIIAEEEPERPSTRLKKGTVAKPELRNPKPEIDSDLDWIVMKCLEKDRNRRYETANGLAADLQRHLNEEPIVARPPSARYRALKFIRRNRTASIGAALVTLTVVFGISVSTWALIRERAARRQSDERLKAALLFVDDIFYKVAPDFVDLTGATSAQEKLSQAGLTFLQRLRSSTGEDSALRFALARVLVKVAEAQSPGSANVGGDYQAGLKRAEEVIELLGGGLPMASDTERLQLLWLAKFNQVLCLYSLGRVDDGISHLAEMDSLLDKLEQMPEFVRKARRNRQGIRNNAGYNTTLAGRPAEALERFLLPMLKSEWARGITTNSDHYELETVMNGNCNVASAYLLLNQSEAMLPYAEEAVRIGDVLVQRFPQMTRYPSKRANCLAHLGYARIRGGEIDRGMAALNESREQIEGLVRKDPLNDFFANQRATTTAIQALAYAALSEQPALSVSVRGERLAQAEAYLAEAQRFSGATRSKDPQAYLAAAQTQVTTAKRRME